MFKRNIEKELLVWKTKENHKPLVIRGARQTGKTTVIREFAKNFTSFVEVNLEKEEQRKIFASGGGIKSILNSIEAIANKKIIPGETLLFLDEIQNSAEAIKLLRYFYEEIPALHIISAGSLLEVRMKKEGWAFPVGRVEFLYLYPFTFTEFLSAMGQDLLKHEILDFNFAAIIPEPIHEKLLELWLDYLIVGGMPEAIKEYSQSQSFLAVKDYQDALVSSFREDFVKYAKESELEYLKLVWDKVPFELGNRIKYTKLGLGNSPKTANAFDILHEAMLIERIYPTVETRLPLVTKKKAAPKACFLDVGLCSLILNLTRDVLKDKLLSANFTGALPEAFVAQELLALDVKHRNPLYFWVREEAGASSELDFLLSSNGKIIPIEVKSGSQGSLKSLHQFLSRSGLTVGMRIYGDIPRDEEHSLTLSHGEKLTYRLISLPFYLIERIHQL
ncbi:ATP-binding protein [Candidatus Saganbacteria bacterium]|nr:ATP-binding protein [Candidatus Saganbacteria bacterium]